MDEAPPDTPAFESTATTAREGEDGSDALQLGPADGGGAAAVPTDEAFAMHLGDAKKRQPRDKPSKPVTAAANASLIAALMGRPLAKPKAGPSLATQDTDAADLTEAASDSLSRYAGEGLGKGTVRPPTAPPPVILTEADPLPAPVPPPVMPQAAVTAIRQTAAPVAVSPTPVVAPAMPVVSPKGVMSGVPVGASVASPVGGTSVPRTAPKAAPQPKPAPPVVSTPLPNPPPKTSVPPRRAIPVAPVWPGEATGATDARVDTHGQTVVAKAESPRLPIELPKPAPMPTGAWWTIPLTFVGIAITACAVIVPAADENRRDTYELTKIERDVDYFQRQSAVNQDFLKRIDTDPTLAERLALRQLHRTREGAKVVALGGMKPDHFGASPYAITRLDPPADLPPYHPVPGKLGEWFLGDKRPQQMAGLGLCVAGAGVLLGGLRKRRRPATPLDA